MKQFLTPDDVTKAPMPVREKLAGFCIANNLKTWKKTKDQMEGVVPDEYNLPLFSIGQLIQFIRDYHSKTWYKYVIEDEEAAKAELIDLLWKVICKGEEGKKNGK